MKALFLITILFSKYLYSLNLITTSIFYPVPNDPLTFVTFSGIYILMENLKRYNRLTEYLKNKFGERVLKICIDGGFTCPNRDGTAGLGGCIFCSEAGFW